MAELDDFGKTIAENIGYMPVVQGAGKAGAGAMDWISSLFGGGDAKAQPTPKAQPQQQAKAPAQAGGGFMDFLSGLLGSVGSGARGSMDALQTDIDAVKQLKSPPELTKLLSQAMMMTGRGGFGPGLARIPAQRVGTKVFDPDKGWIWREFEDLPSVDPIKSLFMKPGDFNDLMSIILQRSREQAPWLRNAP